MNDREILKQAYDALGLINHRGNTDEELQKVGLTRVFIEARLEEPEPEPIGWYEKTPSGDWFLAYSYNPEAETFPLYLHPPRQSEEVYELRAENLTLKKALKLYIEEFGELPTEGNETLSVVADLIKDV